MITRTSHQVGPPFADVWCMSLSQLGSAAGGAVDAPRRPEPATPTVPQPTAQQPTAQQPSDAERLLDAVRRGLVPGDPVARLLAGWVGGGRSPVTGVHC
jgi:hypothetical protein